MKKMKLTHPIVFALLLVAFTFLAALGGPAQSVSAAPAAVECTPAAAAPAEPGPYTPSEVEKCEDPAMKANCADTASCDLITKYVNPLIIFIGILAGIAVTIGIIIGGIQYASSGGDPQKAAAGKQHIKMSVVALIGFIFLWALLRFLLPGGRVGY